MSRHGALRHRNNFDFVRLFGAFCVLLSHQHVLSGRPEPTVGLTSLGGFGVMVFFTVSGYLVARSWDADPHLGRFALKRFLRIWPGFAVVILLAAYVWGPLMSALPAHEYFQHYQLEDYLNNLYFRLRDVLPVRLEGNALPTAVNGALWTLPLEAKCYLVLATMGVAGLLRREVWLVLFTCALLVPYAVVEPRGEMLSANLQLAVEDRLLLEYGLFFAAGALMHKLSARQSARVWLAAVAGLICGAVAYFFGRYFLAFWFWVAPLVIAIGSSSTPVVRAAGRFGDISYGLYIYAFPVQQTLIWKFGKTWSWGAVLAATIVVTTLLAFLSWHLVEKHALKWKPRTGKEAPSVEPESAVQAAT